MNLRKSFFILFSYGIFSFLLFSSLAFAACSNTLINTKIYQEISSGSFNNLGNFNENTNVFIKSDLGVHPLKFVYIIENAQDNCTNNDDILMKLFQSSSSIEADGVKTTFNGTSYISEATFNFKVPNFVASGPFVSTYSINQNNNINSGSFSFKLDNTGPQISFTLSPIKQIYKSGDLVTLDYSINDYDSGLSSLFIYGGGVSKQVSFTKNNQSYSDSLSLNLTTNTKVFFTINDKLSNENVENKTFIVDGDAPQIINNLNSLKFDKIYTSNSENSRKIVFNNIILSDDSFPNKPTLIGNFTSINSNAKFVSATCQLESNGNYNCAFPPIEIDFSSTTNSQIILTTRDSVGNSKSYNYNTQIYIDSRSPEILDFYFMNKRGIRNIVTINDNSSYVYLKFKEESIKDNNIDPTINPNFDLLSFPENLLPSNNCDFDRKAGIAECIWQIGDKIGIFTDVRRDGGNFSIQVIDKFRNSAQKNFSFIIDNIPPILSEVKVIETNDVTDGLVKSAETINFKVFISDDNLQKSNNFFVSADFTRISAKNGYDFRDGSCSLYNTTHYQCNFNGIQVRNGYRNDTIVFNISDIAGNTIFSNSSLEIFKVGNEVDIAYIVKDLNKENLNSRVNLLLLNPINRNIIIEKEQWAWFEGKVTLKTPTDNFHLVNFHLISCNGGRNDTPLIVSSEKLYPQEVIEYQNLDGDGKFALKIKVDDANVSGLDLNDFSVDCSFAILKKDKDTIYPVEFVNFTLKIGFYNNLRGDYLKANARKISDLINEANFLGEWFDQIYSIYQIFKGICTVVNTAGGVLSTVSGVLDGVQLIAAIYNADKALETPRKFSEYGKDTIMEMLGGEEGFVRKACDWITCNGKSEIFGGGTSDLFGIMEKMEGFKDSKIADMCKK